MEAKRLVGGGWSESRDSIRPVPTMAAFLGVITLLKVSLLRSLAFGQDVPGETLDLCLLDRTMTPLSVSLSLLGQSSWNT
jgi:hypothetical protein